MPHGTQPLVTVEWDGTSKTLWLHQQAHTLQHAAQSPLPYRLQSLRQQSVVLIPLKSSLTLKASLLSSTPRRTMFGFKEFSLISIPYLTLLVIFPLNSFPPPPRVGNTLADSLPKAALHSLSSSPMLEE